MVEKVSLRIDADVKGVDQVDRLVNELENLDDVSVQLANELRETVNRLKQLTDVNQAVESFRRLKEESVRTAEALKQQQAATATVAKSFKEIDTAVTATAQKQDQLKARITELQNTLNSAKTGFNTLKTAITESGNATSEQTSEYFRFERVIKETSEALKASRSELSSINQEQRKLTSTLNQQGVAFEKARNSVRQLKDEQQQQRVSLQNLRTELQKAGVSTNDLANAQSRIRSELSQTNQQYIAAVQNVQQFRQGLEQAANTAAKGIPDPTKKATAGLRAARFAADSFSQAITGIGATLGGAALVQTTAQIDGLKLGLELLTGSAEGASEQLDFVRQTADRLGLELLSTATSYQRLLAASKGTILEGENTGRIFTAISGSLSLLGRSAFEVEGALRAVEQIISKGKVQAEELRGQLGERLPGAFQIAARAVGLTTAELSKQLELGNIYSDQFLPKFAAELEKTFRLDQVERVETLSAAMNRLKNNITEAVNSFQEAGGATVLGDFFDAIGTFTKLVQTGAAETGAFAAATVDSIGDIGNAIGDLDFEGLGDKISSNFALAGEVADDAANKILDAGKKIETAGKQVTETTLSVKKLLDVTAAESASFEETLNRAFSQLNLDSVVNNIATAEKRFTEAFDMITERSRITQETLSTLRDVIGQPLSPAGIQAVTGALNDIFKNGESSKTVIEELRNELLTIEPAANIGQITDGLSDLVRLGGESKEAMDLLNTGLAGLSTGNVQSVISALEQIEQKGVGSEQVITALRVALEGVKTPEGVLAIGRALQEADIGADAFQKGMELVRQRLAEAERETERLRLGLEQTDAIFQSFGIESSANIVRGFEDAGRALEQLRDSGNATARDLQRAFFASTEQIITKFGDLDVNQRQQVANLIKAQAEAVGLGNKLSEAAIQTAIATGNTAQLTTELGKAKDAALSAVKSIAGIKAAFDGSIDSVKAVSEALFGQKDTVDKTTDSVRSQKSAYDEVAGSVQKVSEAQQRLNEFEKESIQNQAAAAAAAGFVNTALDNIRNRLGEISQSAVEAFENRIGGGADAAGNKLDSLTDRIAHANSEILRLRSVENSASSGVFTQIAAFYSRLADEVELSALRQQAALETLAQQAASGSQSALNQLSATGSELETLRQRFDLVDQSTFDSIISEIQRLNGELSNAADRTEQLKDRLESLRATSELERQELENQRALRDIQREIDEAQRAGNDALIAELQQQLELQRQINEEEVRRIKNVENRAKAEKRAKDSSVSDDTDTDTGRSQPRRNGSGGAPIGGAVPQFPASTGQSPIIVMPLSEKSANRFLKEGMNDDVVREAIRPALERINKFRK